MTKAILTLYDMLTPFDLRAQYVELPTYWHEHTRKKLFLKNVQNDLAAYKNFFENAHDSKWAISKQVNGPSHNRWV